MAFIYWLCRVAVENYVSSAIAGLVAVFGIVADFSPEQWPAGSATVLFFVAFLIAAYVFYNESISAQNDPAALGRLRQKKTVTFGEIATELTGMRGLDRKSLLHRLMRAMWRGDFEHLTGHSRLTIPSSSGVRIVDGQSMSLEDIEANSDDYVERDVTPSPPRIVFDRPMLASPELGISHIYPTLSSIRRDGGMFTRKDVKLIKFELLESIDPDQYDPSYIRNYIERLSMERADFRRWLSRLRRGQYES